MAEYPTPIKSFIEVLEQQNFNIVREQYDDQSFGNTILTYSDGRVIVDLCRDRGNWLILFSDIDHLSEMFDIFLLRQYQGLSPIPVHNLQEQVDAATVALPFVRQIFDPVLRAQTRRELESLGLQRARNLGLL